MTTPKKNALTPVNRMGVLKALNPEEMSLVENILAIATQLKSLGAAGGEEPAPAMGEEQNQAELAKYLAAMEKQPGQEDQPEDIMKADDELDARKPAEDKMDIGTDVNDANLPITKMQDTLAMLLGKLSLAKSATRTAPVQPAGLQAITAAVQKALSPVVERLNQIEQFNENMLDALGVTQNVEKSIEAGRLATQPVQKALPVQSTDQNAIAQEILKVFKSIANQQGGNDYRSIVPERDGVETARKDLGSAMELIFASNIERRNRLGRTVAR